MPVSECFVQWAHAIQSYKPHFIDMTSWRWFLLWQCLSFQNLLSFPNWKNGECFKAFEKIKVCMYIGYWLGSLLQALKLAAVFLLLPLHGITPFQIQISFLCKNQGILVSDIKRTNSSKTVHAAGEWTTMNHICMVCIHHLSGLAMNTKDNKMRNGFARILWQAYIGSYVTSNYVKALVTFLKARRLQSATHAQDFEVFREMNVPIVSSPMEKNCRYCVTWDAGKKRGNQGKYCILQMLLADIVHIVNMVTAFIKSDTPNVRGLWD